MPSLAGARIARVVIAGAAALMLAVCVAGPWEVGQAARDGHAREACESMRSLTQGLSVSMRAMAASIRASEQVNRGSATTWRAMSATIPELHSSGDDILLQISTDVGANDERIADQEEQLAIETDRDAAEFEARVATPCGMSGL